MNNLAWTLDEIKNKKLDGSVYSTFACGGGSSMGYKLAGLNVLGANDIDKQMKKHYKANLNPEHYDLCPISKLIEADLPDFMFELDILDGSPPCSTFSTAGSREKDWGKERHFREGQAKQVLDDLFFDFIALADRLKPKIIISENVTGIIKGRAKGYAKMIVERLKEAGYRTQVFQINAARCGVPQIRERVFFISIMFDLYRKDLVLDPNENIVTFWDAVHDIQDLTDDEIRDTRPNPTDEKHYSLTRQGQNYSTVNANKSFFNHYRLPLNRPVNTLLATHSNYMHPTIMRKLTFREFKRLSSFPDDYWAETDNIGKYMCGMSVPPKMMQCVAKAVKEQWINWSL